MFKKILIYLIGLMILTLGITINTQSELGVGAILVLPYFFSNLTGLSLPLTSFIFYIICILAQLYFILKIKDRQLLVPLGFQLIVSFFLSWMLDITMRIIPPLTTISSPAFYSHFAFRLITLTISFVLIGIGVAAMLFTDLALTPPDGIVKIYTLYSGRRIDTVKMAFDILLVAVTLGMAYLTEMYDTGIYIGTILGLVIVGPVMAWFDRHIALWLDTFLT